MHTVPSGTLDFIFQGLRATPDVLRLIVRLYPQGPAWDIRKDPERFTAREVLAHLADWEQVLLGGLA